MSGYSIPFSFKAEGLSDIQRLESFIAQVGKSANASAGNLSLFDSIIRKDIESGRSLEASLRDLSKTTVQGSTEFQKLAKEFLNAGKEAERAQREIDKMGRTMDAALRENASRAQSMGRAMDAALRENAQRSKKAADEANQAGNQFASGILRIGQSAGVVDGQLAGMTRGVAGLSGGLGSLLSPTTLAAGGFVALGIAASKSAVTLVREYSAAARETEKFAERLGLTIGQARQLEQVGGIAGVNVRSLEAAARLLGTALDDSSGTGKKAANALQRLGVETLTTTGETREMGAVLVETIDRLSKVKDAAERAHIANQILGRGSKEILPLIEEYDELRQRLHALGIEYDDSVLKKAADNEKRFKELGLAWQYFKDKLAQGVAPVIIPILFKLPQDIQNLNDKLNPASVGEKLARAANAEIERIKERLARTLTPGDLNLRPPSVPDGFGIPNSFAASVGFKAKNANTEEGLKAQIKNLEAENAKLRPILESGKLTADSFNLKEREFNQNAKKIEQLQAQIDKTKELSKLQEQLPEMRKALRREQLQFQAEGSPTARAMLEGIFAVQDSPTRDLKIGNAELATQRLQKAAKEELERFLKENAKVLKEDTPRDKKSLDLIEVKRQDKELTAQIAADKKILATIDAADTARINDQSSAIRAKADQQAKIVALMAGPGGELNALRVGLELRLAAAKAELDLKQRRSDLFDVVKAQIDYEKEKQKANYEYQLAALEKLKREKDAFRQDTVRFFNDLISGNGANAFKSIGKNLMDQVVGNAAGMLYGPIKNSLTRATSGIDTSKGMGALLSGTIFDNKAGTTSVPAKIDTTNQLLGRVVANTTPRGTVTPSSVGGVSIPQIGGAVDGFSGVLSGLKSNTSSMMPGVAADSILAGILGASIGTSLPALTSGVTRGTPSTQSYTGLSGLMAGLSHTGDLRGIATGISRGPNGSTETLSNTERVGAAIGTAGVVFGGTMTAIDQFKRGGAKGTLGGISAVTGTAAALDPDPISKTVLAGVALATSMISTLLGDPKEQRAKQIDKEIGNSRYFAPVSLRANMDTSGNYFDYGADGSIRTSQFRGIPQVAQPYQWYRNGQYEQFPGRTLSPYQDPNAMPMPYQGSPYAPTPIFRQGPNASGTANVTVNVSTMDSKSFKDNAGLIANAMHHAIESGRAEGFLEAQGRRA